MNLRILLACAALACAPALHGQQVAVQPGALFAAVDTMYTIDTESGDTTAVAVQTLRRASLHGEEVWEVEYLYAGARGSMADTTWFDTATLLPREQRRAGITRRIDVRFDPARIRLRRGAGPDGTPADSAEIPTDQPVFAGSLLDLVYRSLPLREGLTARIPFFIPERAEVWWADVSVPGTGVVRTRDGWVDAWRVEARLQGSGLDVFWLDRDTRALLRVDQPEGTESIIR
jgi:hypothetical protein